MLNLPSLKNKTRKTLESRQHQISMTGALISRLLLADIGFTFLPVLVIFLITWGTNKLDDNFWYSSDMAFAAIILSSIALVRTLELKIHVQSDSSDNPLVLAKICLFLIISSVVLLTLYVLQEQNIDMNEDFIELFQISLITMIIIVLVIIHRQTQLDLLRHLKPETLTKSELIFLLIDSLSQSRRDIHNLILCAKSYPSTTDELEIDEHKKAWFDSQINDRIDAIERALEDLKHVKSNWDAAETSNTTNTKESD